MVRYTLLAVNGQADKPDVLKTAVTMAKADILRQEDRFSTVRLDYHAGLQDPHLQRLACTPDRLTAIFKLL